MCESTSHNEEKSSPEEPCNPYNGVHPKIRVPRPPNAFMLFGQDYRRKLKSQYPNESNQAISVRLGQMWKNLSKPLRDKYFSKAHVANEEHRKKYPGYIYNPKEARARKQEQKSMRTNESYSTRKRTQIQSSNSEATYNSLDVKTGKDLERRQQDDSQHLDIKNKVYESMGLSNPLPVYGNYNFVDANFCEKDFGQYYPVQYTTPGEYCGVMPAMDCQNLGSNSFDRSAYCFGNAVSEDSTNYAFHQNPAPHQTIKPDYHIYARSFLSQNEATQYFESDYESATNPSHSEPHFLPQTQDAEIESKAKEYNNETGALPNDYEFVRYLPEDLKSDYEQNYGFGEDETLKQTFESAGEGTLYRLLD